MRKLDKAWGKAVWSHVDANSLDGVNGGEAAIEIILFLQSCGNNFSSDVSKHLLTLNWALTKPQYQSHPSLALPTNRSVVLAYRSMEFYFLVGITSPQIMM